MVPALRAAAASGRTILAPNAELAAALFDAIERAHRDAGDGIWPTPRVFDFASWLREQHAQQQLKHLQPQRVLSDIEERELWRTVIDAAAGGGDFLDPAGAARAARRARRTLSEYGIPLQALHSEPSEEVAAFLSWNRAFEDRCRELRCIAGDVLLSRVEPLSDTLDWIESPQWRPAARRWLEPRGRMLLPEESGAGTVSLRSAGTAAEEISAAAEWAARKSDEHLRAWICVPDLELRRAEVIDAFDAALAPRRFGLGGAAAASYAVAGGSPLAEYAPVRAALQLLQAASGSVSFADFSALLRSPELHGADAEAGGAARLDLALRRRASNEADLSTWLDLADRVAQNEGLGDSPGVQRLRSAQQGVTQLKGAHRFSEWVAIWIAAFELAPWAFRARWSSTEYQAAERFRELLAALAAGDAVFGAQRFESAQRILRRAARDTAFQVQTGVPRIWVSGQILDPFLHYGGLWVCGCSDEQWPAPTAPVALLPVRLQRQYGVIAASADEQLAHARQLQSRWQRRATQCVFSYADAAEGSHGAPSPLLPKLPEVPEVPELAKLPELADHPAIPATPAVMPQPHWHAMQASAPALESLWDERAPAYAAGERTRGVATLRAQSRCAFRGFAETRLDAQPLDQPIPGFNERERGEIVHHALEHVWSVLRDWNALHALNPLQQGLLLNDAAADALQIVCRRRDPGRRWRLREQVRVQNLLGKWLDVERGRAPFSVEALETNAQVARFAGLDFGVRIDRVDRLQDGARVLLDYKTGAASPDWRGERPDNPQLPIYALLQPDALVAVAYAKVSAADSSFVAESERSRIFPRSHATKLEGMATFAELIQIWSRRLERIAGEFAAGHAEVAPTIKACQSCHLQGLCRVPAALEEEPDELHE